MSSFLKFYFLIALISLCEEINPAKQSRRIKSTRKSISKTGLYQMPRLIYSDYDFPDYGEVVYTKVPHKLYLRKANSEEFSEENERPWKIYPKNQVEKPAVMEPSSADIPPPPPFIPYNYDYYDYFFIEAGAGPPPPPPGPPPPGWVWGPLEPPQHSTTTTTTSTTQASTSSQKPAKTRPPPKTTTQSPSKPLKSRPTSKTTTLSPPKLESKGQAEEAKPLMPKQVQKETPIQKGIKDIAIRGSDQDNFPLQHATEKPQPPLILSPSQPSDNPSSNPPRSNFFKVAWNKLIDIFKFSNVYDSDVSQQATNETNGIVIDKQENNNKNAFRLPLFLIN